MNTHKSATSQAQFPQNKPVQAETLGSLLSTMPAKENAGEGKPEAMQGQSGQTLTMELAIKAITGRGWQTVPVDVTTKDSKGKFKKKALVKWGGNTDFQDDGTEFPGRTANTEKALQWLAMWPKMGIAIATGSRSQNGQGQWLLLLDFDKPEYWQAFCDLCKQNDFDLPDTYVEKTPNGWHCLFWASPELQGVGTKSKIQISPSCELDTRWQGGYFITAPSVNADGGKYEVIHDCQPAVLPKWLERLLDKSNGQPDQRQGNLQMDLSGVRPHEQKTGHGGNYTARLERYQQTALDGEFAKLAQTTEGGCNDQVNDSAFNLGKIEGLSYQQAWDCLHKACEVNGYIARDGEHAFRNSFNSGWNAGQKMSKRGPKDLFQRVGGMPETKSKLPAPIPADTPKDKIQWPVLYRYDDLDLLEQFSIDNHGFGLPAILAQIIQAQSVALQIPQGTALCAYMGAFAAACQGKWRLKVRQGYSVPLSLFLMAPLSPGNRKSALVKAAKMPILDHEAALQAKAEERIKEALTRRKIADVKIADLERQASKAKDPIERESLTRLAIEERLILEDLPVRPVLSVDDCTPEALVIAMSTNRHGLSVIEAEGTLLDILAGQYNDGKANITAILKAHDEEPIKQFRVNREWVTVTNPNLTLSIFPQPIVLKGREKAGEQMRYRGFDARWLYALCKSIVGYRSCTPNPVPEQITEAYNGKIKALFEYPDTLDKEGNCLPYEITLAPEAYQLWSEVDNALEVEMRPTGIFADLKDFASKLAGHIARIAGILHCIEHYEPHKAPVSAQNMERAIQLGAWFSSHSQAAYSLMDGSGETGLPGARAILEWIMDSKKSGGVTTEFSERDAWRALGRRSQFKGRKSEAFEPALVELLERGYLVQYEKKSNAGASTKGYWVNPAVFTDEIPEE